MNTNLSPDAAVDRLRRCREEERADECKRNLMGRFSEAVEFSVRDIRFIQRKILLGSLETSTRDRAWLGAARASLVHTHTHTHTSSAPIVHTTAAYPRQRRRRRRRRGRRRKVYSRLTQ